MVGNKTVLFIVAPLLTLILLNAINPIQEPILKGNDKDPVAFLRLLGAPTHETSKEASPYKEVEIKVIPNAIVYYIKRFETGCDLRAQSVWYRSINQSISQSVSQSVNFSINQ